MRDETESPIRSIGAAPDSPSDWRQLKIVRGKNDLLYDEQGNAYVDMFSGHGATWLGHCNANITRHLQQQIQRLWLSGGLATDITSQALQSLDAFLPHSLRTATLYSTGMEAAEFAMRFAQGIAQRKEIVGFAGSMHGKSAAMAQIGWPNYSPEQMQFIHRLPFVQSESESQVLEATERKLKTGSIAAVFVEPLQASSGGHMASPGFCREVRRLCDEHGALLVFDEILTGFYRTGKRFYFQGVNVAPDVVLLGKALGNGFPVSAVAIRRALSVRPEMLIGSTFSSNPLAAAAVVGTLSELRAVPSIAGRVATMEHVIRAALEPAVARGTVVRGKGALWTAQPPPTVDMELLVRRIATRRVCVNFAKRQMRILPALTIDADNLDRGCRVIAEEISRVVDGS